MNNWMLSSARAEATRKALAASGIGNDRFARIEGVADREPFAKGDVYDPRNRRMSIILGWSHGANGGDADEQADAETRAAIRERDNPMTMARTEAQIGRGSRREGVCRGVCISAGAVKIKKKKE